MRFNLLKGFNCRQNLQKLIIRQEIKSRKQVSLLFQKVLKCLLNDLESLIISLKYLKSVI